MMLRGCYAKGCIIDHIFIEGRGQLTDFKLSALSKQVPEKTLVDHPGQNPG